MSLREQLIIKPEGLDFATRGYQPGRPEVRAILGPHAQSFVGGYNGMIMAGNPAVALAEFDVPAAERAFAVEGIAMAAVLLDLLTAARGRRTRKLLAMEGDQHRHLVHFGAGFAISRLRWRGWLGLGSLDPVLRWLAYDGAGFSVAALGDDHRVRELGRHQFRCNQRCSIRHQGVGRAVWFIESADLARVTGRIASFPRHHHGDLWSGIAFAAVMAARWHRMMSASWWHARASTRQISPRARRSPRRSANRPTAISPMSARSYRDLRECHSPRRQPSRLVPGRTCGAPTSAVMRSGGIGCARNSPVSAAPGRSLEGRGWSGRCGGRAAGGFVEVEPFVLAVPPSGR